MVIDYAIIDTTPGAGGNTPFTPPADFLGDAAAYRQLMQQRYAPVQQRQFFVAAVWVRRHRSIQFTGPFADEARAIIDNLEKRLGTPEPSS